MRKTRFTEEHITHALPTGGGGNAVPEVIRKLGVSEQSFYRWKRGDGRGGGAAASQLEEENRKLKGLVADLSLDKLILQDVIEKRLYRLRRTRPKWTISPATRASRKWPT